jgi:hypothetical protein
LSGPGPGVERAQHPTDFRHIRHPQPARVAGFEKTPTPGAYWDSLQGEARWAIRVTGNWRTTFGWDRADAAAIDLED